MLTTALLTGCGDSPAMDPVTAPPGGGTGGDGGAGGAVTVTVGNNLFRSDRNGSTNAAVDTVVVGGKVTWKWVNSGSVPHNVASVGMPSFTSGGIKTGNGSTYEITFTSPGTYRYNCAIHGNLMTGVVVVTAPAPAPSVSLKDVVIPNLPSPYYHFEYDTSGRVSGASFASGLEVYNVDYMGDRISQIRAMRSERLLLTNDILVTRDRLVYVYDDAGRVSEIGYTDSTGAVYKRLRFAYDGPKLMRLARERRSDAGFFVDKTMSMSYGDDGNLLELIDRRTDVRGSPQGDTYVDRFEQYDDGLNVDGFSLLHNEVSDHLVLLPGVQLQNGNPRRQTRTGDGLNFTVDYSYTYDAERRPLSKRGEARVTSGPNAGERFQTRSVFSY